MRRKGALFLGALLLGFSALVGCGSQGTQSAGARDMTSGAVYNNSGDVYSYASEDADYSMDDVVEEEDYDDASTEKATDQTENAAQSGRKLIKRVSLTVETTEFEELTTNLTARVDKLGGYIESSDVYGGGIYDSRTRRASFTIRIPALKLDSFVQEVAQTSNITYQSQNVEDITLQYVDLQSKKEALMVEQERLLALLEQADSLESVIALESRLTDVRYELQSMESRLRTYDNQVDYATVNLEVQEVEIYTPPEPKSVWEEIGTGFSDSLRGVGRGIVDFVVAFIILLPYLVVWGIVIVVIVFVIRKLRKRRKAKKEKKKELMKQQTEVNAAEAGEQTAVTEKKRTDKAAEAEPGSKQQ